MARPTKLNPERQAIIVAAIRAGNYAATAARLAGISENTYYVWLSRDREPYQEFREAVKKAEAAAEAAAIGIVRLAAHDSWQAAAWWLERRYPDRWGRASRIDINLVREEARQLARERGLDPDEVVAQAETWLRKRGSRE